LWNAVFISGSSYAGSPVQRECHRAVHSAATMHRQVTRFWQDC
jgi:hypothetical protein